MDRLGGSGCVRTACGESGQGTVEWVGLVAMLASLFAVLALSGLQIPGTAVVHGLSRSLLCAAALSKSCFGEGSLEEAYGADLAGLVKSNAPEMLFGPDLLGLPVDFRSCRAAACADPPAEGEVLESLAGEPPTLFTRVIDCRNAPEDGRVPVERTSAIDCSGRGEGSIYIQYWAYFPESASLRGLPVLEKKGYHLHDWESTQLRISADGEVKQRASSHAGYNYGRSIANWGSDAGIPLFREAAEAVGLRSEGGWGEASGRWLVAGGSHAGNVADPHDASRYPWRISGENLRLVPLESIEGGPLVRPARFDPITPPWAKEVWTAPEAEGTG